MNRRNFITGVAALASSNLLIAQDNEYYSNSIEFQNSYQSDFDTNYWANRTIDLQYHKSNERYLLPYWTNGSINYDGYIAACQFLRDRHTNDVVQMDLRLLDVIYLIQGYIGAFGFNKTMMIHSAYRSPKTNSKIEGAARNSKHMNGEAIDFHINKIPADYMGKLSQLLLRTDGAGGGVGFYTNSNFTHVDTSRGRERVWRHSK